jgi:hypothetical protein
MTWWAAGGAVVGGLLASQGSKGAAGAQAEAANNSTALQRDIYNQTVERNRPYVEGGTNALSTLLNRLGIAGNAGSGYGSLMSTVDPQSVQNDPGYQWAQQQGEQGIQRALAARGLTGSGRGLKEASRFNTGNATQFFDRAFNRNQATNLQNYNMLAQPAQWGQNSANNTAAQGSAFGQAAGGNMVQAGDAEAANSIAQGNIWGNAINQGLSSYSRSPQGNSPQSQPQWAPNQNYGATGFPDDYMGR